MRFFAFPILFFCYSLAVSAEDVVIAFPVEVLSEDDGNTTTVLGFQVISAGEVAGLEVAASESALSAVRDLNIKLGTMSKTAADAYSLDLAAPYSEDTTTVSEFFVQIPNRIPGDKQYPGGGGGWWPPRIIWPPQDTPDDVDAASIPKPWPGGGGGWWPPKAAAVADEAENDLLRSIYLNTHMLADPVSNSGAQLIVVE